MTDIPATNVPADQPPAARTIRSRLGYWLPGRQHSRSVRVLLVIAWLLVIYLLSAYVIAPLAWSHYEHRPGLEQAPKITETKNGIPGDPLNVGLVGEREEVLRAMVLAGWQPADPITFDSSIEIAASVVLRRPDPKAPVSNLYLFGRKQDLAFEKESGRSAKERHHVRFWQYETKADPNKRPLWVGSATFDHSVGVSHLTGQITHHIGPDVDAERNALIASLAEVGQLTEEFQVTGVGANLQGRNGGGDWYYTDGEMTIGVISPGNAEQTNPPEKLANPVVVQWKNAAWEQIRSFLQ